MERIRKILCVILCASLAFSNIQVVNAKETGGQKQYDIYPIVRDISYDQTEFTLNDQVNVVYETGIDEATKGYLEEVLEENGITSTTSQEAVGGKYNILLGTNGSGEAADTYENSVTLKKSDLYDQYDGYLLEAKENQITIVGRDSDAVFRGVATLKMMLSSFEGNTLLGAHIEDYAGIQYRGFIEGFYGGWDYKTRESLMRFAKDVKMNMYVYASKTDAYHTNKWNELYPDSEINQIRELVKVGEETKCRYVWSVHLSGFFNGLNVNDTAAYENRYQQLTAKFTQLYDAGVRKFDILNDDFGSGSNEDVVTLLNRLNREFIEAKGCEPITYCPQGYNRAWSGNGAELNALAGLDDSIILYWTGDDVNSPITQETINYVKEKTGQEISFWLNYPVNEHASSGIFLGNIDHYARDGVTGLRAAVSNPSRFGQSNKVALFQLAALFWNNSDYSSYSDEIWTNSFRYLEPEVSEAYLTIARNTANCPSSGRVPAGFPESEYIKDSLETVLEKINGGEPIKDTEEFAKLQTEFSNILSSVETFRGTCTNSALIQELTPWLNSLTDVVAACKSALTSAAALEEENVSEAWSQFAAASKFLQSWNSYPTFEGSNKNALAGSKRLQPFATKMISYVNAALTPLLDSGSTDFTPSLYAKIGGQVRNQDSNAEKMFDGNVDTYAEWRVNQQRDDYFGVDLGRVIKVKDIEILQANSDTHHDYFHKAVLEYSQDGKTFTQLGEQYNDTVRIQLDKLDIQARYIRLRLVETGTATAANYWTYVREFTVNRAEGDRIYTNMEEYSRQPLTITGKEYSIADLSNVTLKSGEYIGMKFTKLSGASAFVKQGTNLDHVTLEISDNGTLWTEVTNLAKPQVFKYLRLINKTDADITFDLEKAGALVENVKADLSFLETNLTQGLQEGSWDNVFDGDLSTFAWTNEPQAAGDYITFDLGSVISVYDLSIVTVDGNPRLYNAEIQISQDRSNWETIATVENDNSVFEVPHRYVNANAGGKDARYLRIYITGNSGYYLKLEEIIINQTVDAGEGTKEITANFGSGADKAIDGNIATLFHGTPSSDGSIEYKFTETTRYREISVLQDPNHISNATVKVLTDNGYETVGTLDESAKRIPLDSEKDVYGLKIEVPGGIEISVYEIYLDAAGAATDDIGEYEDPIINEGTALIPSNIAIGKEVTVSGTSDGNKDNVNDGNPDTKWDSDFIKGNGAKENAWVTLDLGADKTSIFNAMTMSYHNKVYPTVMEIQISNDKINWISVDQLTAAADGPTYPVVTDSFEPALTARYVRLLFDELNSVAAGNGVGLKEWEITGVSAANMSVKEVQVFEDVNVEKNTPMENLNLENFVTVTLTHPTAGDYEVKVPVTWNTSAYDPAQSGIYTLEGTLDLPASAANTESRKASVRVIVGDVTPEPTETPVPTETPKPTETPVPTETPEPTETPVPTEPVTKVFTDVYDDWYTDYVQYVYDNGLMTGIKGTAKFEPNGNITKAQVAQVLYNMEDQPEVTDKKVFKDLKDVYEAEWYADAVAWAYSTGVVTGDLNSREFSPNADVTREQLALMMYRYADHKGYDVSATSDFAGLKNADKVNNWADAAMRWAVGSGMISGIETKGGLDLAPQGTATRAQMAAILQRFCGTYSK